MNNDLSASLRKKMSVNFKEDDNLLPAPDRKKEKLNEKVHKKGTSAKFSLDDFLNAGGADNTTAAEKQEQRLIYINKWRGRPEKYKEDEQEYHHTARLGDFKLTRKDRI